MGAKHIKKLVIGAYQSHMKAYLDRWRKKNAHTTTQVSGADRILTKMRRRFLRMAWNKYRWATARIDQEDRNEKRLGEVKIRLDFKQKKRVYNALKLFWRRFGVQRRFVKTLINGIDKHNKDAAFRRWKDFRQEQTLLKMTEH